MGQAAKTELGKSTKDIASQVLYTYTSIYAILSQYVCIEESIQACTFIVFSIKKCILYCTYIHVHKMDKYTFLMNTAHTYMYCTCTYVYYDTCIMCVHRYVYIILGYIYVCTCTVRVYVYTACIYVMYTWYVVFTLYFASSKGFSNGRGCSKENI